MRKLIIILLCLALCVNMPIAISAGREPITNVNSEYPSYPTVSLDGFEFEVRPGARDYFWAKNIKIDRTNNNVYVFKDWSVEGAEIEDKNSLRLFFSIPYNDFVLTPNYELLGDVNKDERLNAHDLLALSKEVLRGSSEKAFDVNLDTKVNAKDSFDLKCMLVGCYDVTELYYTVNIEGKDVTTYESPVSDYGTCEFPLVSILEGYGADVQWESDTIASITYNEMHYTLNTVEYTMYLDGHEDNYLYYFEYGYSRKTYTIGTKELYMNDSQVENVLYKVLGEWKLINVDFENRTVNVIDHPNF